LAALHGRVHGADPQRIPSKEIVHNALWFAPLSDPFVQRQYLASNVFSMERGVNDGGIVKGTGRSASRRSSA
jgi:hypothetical protein